MKKAISGLTALIIVAVVCLGFYVFMLYKDITAESSEGIRYYADSASGCCVAVDLGTCTDKELVIGNYIDGYKVTSIHEYAFAFEDHLASVKINDSVLVIEDHAFSLDTKLEYVYIGAGVREIGDNVFNGCNSLKEIEVSRKNQHFKSIDGNLYTKDGSRLIHYSAGNDRTEFRVPDGVTTISSFAFFGNKNLTKITLPDSVKTIERNAFYNCRALTEINLPEGLESVGEYSFIGCDSLTSVVIPSTASILDKVFSECDNLSSVTISHGVDKIGNYAFDNCTALESIYIPATVKSIGRRAFSGCTGLSYAVIEKGVEFIGCDAFHRCGNLTDIYFTGSEEEWNSVVIEEDRAYGDYVPNDYLSHVTIHFNYNPNN